MTLHPHCSVSSPYPLRYLAVPILLFNFADVSKSALAGMAYLLQADSHHGHGTLEAPGGEEMIPARASPHPKNKNRVLSNIK